MIEATVTKRNGDILKRARYSDLKRAGAQAVTACGSPTSGLLPSFAAGRYRA